MKGRVDNTEPHSNKLKHLRPKNFKADAYREREIQNENDSLVLKILQIRASKGNGIPGQQNRQVSMADRRGSGNMGSLKKRRSLSVRSSRSEKRASRTFDRSILGDRSAQAGRIAESTSAERMRYTHGDAMSVSNEKDRYNFETSPPQNDNYNNLSQVQ